MKRLRILSLLFVVLLSAHASSQPLFYRIDLNKEVGSTTWLYVKNGLEEARKADATAVLLCMNTYGGTLVHADSIRTAILNAPIPVYAFIDNNAASAGALIAIACDSIYMRPGASIGAATVVNETGVAMPDKYQSYMRAIIRATAESHGKDTLRTANGNTTVRWRRDPLIAEAMVDQRIVVPGLIDSTSVLTLTTQEAIEHGYCEGSAESVEEVIREQLRTPDFVLKSYTPTWFDEIKGFLTNPALQAILIMLIIGGLYFELQSPGIGFPTLVAVTAAILYFAPLYIDGVAANWEIILFIVGIGLIVTELFVLPGFGIIGIVGILLSIGALALALIGNVHFRFEGIPETEIARSLLTLSSGLLSGFGLILYLSHRIGSRGFFGRLALKKSQETNAGYIGTQSGYDLQIGKRGIAYTPLHPSGKITIGDTRFDAVALYGYIEKGALVEVIRFENNQLYVVPCPKNNAQA